MSLLECKALKSPFSSNQGSPLRSHNQGSVPRSQSHVPAAFPSQSPSPISWPGVQSDLIFLLARSVSREALSPKTERGSSWPCHQQPGDSRWKKCPSFPACGPHCRCSNHRQRAQMVGGVSERGGKICRTAHLPFRLNPASWEWNRSLHLAGWVKHAKGRGWTVQLYQRCSQEGGNFGCQGK